VIRLATSGGRELGLLRWGLIPSWAEEAGAPLINARSETVADKPAFRAAFKQRRCLIPADGFFEWLPVNGKKQPYYICRQDGHPFGFAGLWERWEGADGPPVESCTILTTEANEVVRPLHDRMPVLLDPRDYAAWLDPSGQKPALLELLRPCPSD